MGPELRFPRPRVKRRTRATLERISNQHAHIYLSPTSGCRQLRPRTVYFRKGERGLSSLLQGRTKDLLSVVYSRARECNTADKEERWASAKAVGRQTAISLILLPVRLHKVLPKIATAARQTSGETETFAQWPRETEGMANDKPCKSPVLRSSMREREREETGTCVRLHVHSEILIDALSRKYNASREAARTKD